MCIVVNLCKYYCLLQNMQRRDSLELTFKIPRLSTGSTRKVKTERTNLRLAGFPTFLLRTERLKVKLFFQWAEWNWEARRTSMAIKGGVWRSDRRARRLWTPSRKGSKTDPTWLPPSREPGRNRRGFWTGGSWRNGRGLGAFRGWTARRTVVKGNVQIRD